MLKAEPRQSRRSGTEAATVTDLALRSVTSHVQKKGMQ